MRSSEWRRIQQAIEASIPVPFSHDVWRAHLDIPQVTPLTPTIDASARWNLGTRLYPDRAFWALYTGSREGTSIAEITRHIEGVPLDLRPKYALSRLAVELSRVLDLRDPRTAIGVDQQELERDDYEIPQMIGETAYNYEFEGILAQSATKLGTVLVVFPQRCLPTSRLRVLSTEPLNLSRAR